MKKLSRLIKESKVSSPYTKGSVFVIDDATNKLQKKTLSGRVNADVTTEAGAEALLEAAGYEDMDMISILWGEWQGVPVLYVSEAEGDFMDFVVCTEDKAIAESFYQEFEDQVVTGDSDDDYLEYPFESDFWNDVN